MNDLQSREVISLQDEVEDYIKEHGLLKKYFAKQIGITAPMFSYWLSGKARLSIEKLNKIRELIAAK